MTAPDLWVATSKWERTYPGASAGLLALRNVTNPKSHPALDDARQRLESDLRARYAGMSRAEIRATGHFPANDTYYKRFGQNYHVLMQLDSIVNKGKAIPRRAALVEASFMAELDHGILTASHDLNLLSLPITLDVAGSNQDYVLYNGSTQICKPDDMLMQDGNGILTSIISGPAEYARITPDTNAVVYCVYAPAGISGADVRDHLETIERTVRLFAPNAESIGLLTITAPAAPAVSDAP